MAEAHGRAEIPLFSLEVMDFDQWSMRSTCGGDDKREQVERPEKLRDQTPKMGRRGLENKPKYAAA